MAETQFKYDVFISYNHKDEKWVVGTLLPALENAGLKACLDDRDLIAGRKAHVEIEQALKASRALILVLSQHWFTGEWTQFEIDIAITRDPSGKRYPIIPLLREEGIESRIPAAIGRFNWIGFVNKEHEAKSWTQLFTALGTPNTPIPETLKPSRWFFGHRYGDLDSFTGRADELKLLDDWLANKTESLLIFNAFGGFGKSALTWHWLNNHVDKTIWSTAIWWSFYEKESGFDSFLAEALTHLGIETKERSSRQQVNDLLDVMQKTGLLIVLDGFERLLRQYGRMDAALQEDDEDAEIDPSQRDCTSQSAETFLRGLSDKKIISKVLMTSRLLPRALEGRDGKLQPRCREVNLKGFSPDDAVTYFHIEGIKKATRAEIIEVCSKYDYHPLSLSLLVGLINEDHEKRGDIAAVKNLEIFEDVKARRHHVLKRAYGSLAPERRDLLSKISCFRGSMEYAVLKKVFPSPDLDKALLDLRKRGLLQYADATGRYDMHPIVRHYAYDHFTDEKRRKEAHVQLAMHFIDVMPVTNKKVKTLESLAPIIELYHHMVKAEKLTEALSLFRNHLVEILHFRFGYYQLEIELLEMFLFDDDNKAVSLDVHQIMSTLGMLANAYSFNGQCSYAAELHSQLIRKYEEISEQSKIKIVNLSKNLAIELANLTECQMALGLLRDAEFSILRSIEILQSEQDEHGEARGRWRLSEIKIIQGHWSEAKSEIERAIELFITRNTKTDWLAKCLLSQAKIALNEKEVKSALSLSLKALSFADAASAKQNFHVERDYVRIYQLLGMIYLVDNQLDKSESCFDESIRRDRIINLIEEEANILLGIAQLRYTQGDFKDAQEKASEALLITQRCGYVLQGADVNLFLAQYALEQEKDKAKAKEYALEAKKLATCDGPPYYYKVAYEEAERMLEKLSKT